MRVLEYYLGDFGVLYFQKELLSSPPLPLSDFSAREGAIVIASKETQKNGAVYNYVLIGKQLDRGFDPLKFCRKFLEQGCDIRKVL